MDRILLAVDGSDESARAAALAGRLSAALDAEVDVLHVIERRHLVPPTLADEYERIEHVHLDTETLLRAMGGRIVEDAAHVVREEGGNVGESWVVIGSPAHEIVEYAEARSADTIVLGRRGLGGASGLLLGSVTTRVGHITDCTLVTTG